MNWRLMGMTLPLWGLAACALTQTTDPRTIKSLEGSVAVLESGPVAADSRQKAIVGYRAFLDTAPGHHLRPEAMRRLGDLQLEDVEQQDGAETETAPRKPAHAASTEEYRRAIKWYRDLLQAYPRYPGNDRVMYQLARAYEEGGELKESLQVLDQLVVAYPKTPYMSEVQFRRGELLFTLKSYEASQQAYASIVQQGVASPFYERALYMQGWALFKQSRFEEALNSFFSILDRKLIGHVNGASLDELAVLSRADRELVDDTFRVVSLSLSNLHEPQAMQNYFSAAGRRDYEFLVYQQLGDLYYKQERIKDAADTYSSFGRLHPTHPQAPVLQAKVIDAYQQAGFASLALEAKKEFALRYSIHSEFHKVSSNEAYARVLPLLKTNLEELARYYHASAQKNKASTDYREAARWYRAFLETFPTDPQAPAMNFLLAEMLFEDKQYAAAVPEYEKTAYDYPPHAKSADAGYAALLAYSQQEKLIDKQEKLAWQKRSLDSALRFTEAHAGDARAPAVLTNAAERLYALHAPDRAAEVAHKVLALNPEPSPALRRTAWTVVAHTEFERGAFDRAEIAYQQALILTPTEEAGRGALLERLAASVYKQGEQSRSAGKLETAAAHFARVGKIAPQSTIRANADYDAAATLITLKNWPAAIQVLENFRRQYPRHPLQAEVSDKLAVAYLEHGQWSNAASEFEALALNKNKSADIQRAALWQAAELRAKAGDMSGAQKNYLHYVENFARPLEPATEARFRLASISQKQGQTKAQYNWLRQLIDTEAKGAGERTDRTRYLAATASMTLAEPYYAAYRGVRLQEPLKKSLKNKKEKMQLALKAYGAAAEYGVAEVTTASTYRIAELYRDFSRELLASQRPKGLAKDELEQYNVMLEEQAYPFEEKAIELHELNIQRIAGGVYDQWVRSSLEALGKLRPVRYAKVEKSEVAIDDIR
ncbi:MAG: tetratricopeptide repeat protein [Gammaproteobacteria bacterium]|nr:tetratricopeptide repeat protein [Gammaproteobacteria bacterium]